MRSESEGEREGKGDWGEGGRAGSERRLSIVGIGPGPAELRTAAATRAILRSRYVVGYRPYLELIPELLSGKEVISSSMGREVDRVRAAIELSEEGTVALVSSGDPNVYGMAGLGLEMAPRPSEVEVLPAVTSFTAAACRAGLFFKESIAVISLSDLLTPWPEIERRLTLASEARMPVALYNPKSRRRDWQMLKALELFENQGQKEVLVAKDVGRSKEEIFFTTARALREEEEERERINMTTLVIIPGDGCIRRAPCPGAAIDIVGIGPGRSGDLTEEASEALRSANVVFGAERYLQLIKGLTHAEMISHDGPCPERMASRMKEARRTIEAGGRAAILTGGDPSIFSSGWRMLEDEGARAHICTGVSAFSSVAARAGAPLVGDFALLSNARDPDRIRRLADAGFAVAAYNVQGHEIAPILHELDSKRPVALAQDLTREKEKCMILYAEDMARASPSGSRFTLLIASARSGIRDGRIITRRGYDSKYSY